MINEYLYNIKVDYVKRQRRDLIQDILLYLMKSDVPNVWNKALQSFKEYYGKVQESEFVEDLIDKFAAQVTEKGEELPEFGKIVSFIQTLVNFNLRKVVNHVENILFSGELSFWKLEVIANCAGVFSLQMYMVGHLKKGLDFFSNNYSVSLKKQINIFTYFTRRNPAQIISKCWSIPSNKSLEIWSQKMRVS